MGGGEGAEPFGERDVGLVVEVVLAAEEDDLVLQDRGADPRHVGVVEVAGEAYAVDPGADAATEPVHLEVGVGGLLVELERHGIPFINV